MKNSLMCMGLTVLLVTGCGVSKDLNGAAIPHSMPELQPREKVTVDKDTKVLKMDDLKMTFGSQSSELNAVQLPTGAAQFLKIQKIFLQPIQFRGWIQIDQVVNASSACAQNIVMEPRFTLLDDHRGSIEIKSGEQHQLVLEKIYYLKVEMPNTAGCDNVDLKFGIIYGE